MMHQPVQSAPVERLYMRPVVGRGSPSERPAEDEEPGKKRGKGEKRPHARRAGDFLIELTTFHIRPRRRSGL